MSLVSEDANQIDLEDLEKRLSKLDDEDNIEDPKDAYQVRLTAKVTKDGNLSVTPTDHPQAARLKEEFELQKQLFSASVDISQWLSTKVMPLLNAANYRDRGGVYILSPGEDIARLEGIANALHSISQFDANGRLLSGCKLYTVPVVAGENLQEALIDSLMEDLDSLTADISEKVTENKLSLRGWASCRNTVLAVATKFKKFETFMGISLETLTERLEELNNNIGGMEASLMFEREEAARAKKTK
jgi:hypothetical protein